MEIAVFVSMKKGLQPDFKNPIKKIVDDFIGDHLNIYPA